MTLEYLALNLVAEHLFFGGKKKEKPVDSVARYEQTISDWAKKLAIIEQKGKFPNEARDAVTVLDELALVLTSNYDTLPPYKREHYKSISLDAPTLISKFNSLKNQL